MSWLGVYRGAVRVVLYIGTVFLAVIGFQTLQVHGLEGDEKTQTMMRGFVFYGLSLFSLLLYIVYELNCYLRESVRS